MAERVKEAPEAKPEPTLAEKIAEFKRLKAELSRQEQVEGPSGAIPLTPKQKLLDASDVQAQHPDKHIRWLNVGNTDKMAVRTEVDGYERVPTAEGGKQVGNLALFAISREAYEEKLAEIARKNKERLTAHQAEVEKMADDVAKVLRDKHGFDINPDDFLIRG